MNSSASAGPRRILHITGRMDRAGAETMVMNLYREIDRSAFQFDFVYFTEDRCDYDEEIEALGGRIHRIGATNRIARYYALYRLLQGGVWETVHSHTLFSIGPHLAAAKLTGIPHRVAHSHATQAGTSGTVAGRVYSRVSRRLIGWAATRFVACGVAAAAYLFPGRTDVVVLPNAVDIERFSGASGDSVREQLGTGKGQIVIVQIGRFMPVKNHERSIRIARALRESGVDFRLMLVGNGPGMAGIEALVREYGLEQHVRLLGLRADIPELMAVADVMLMPSVREGFPVVLVEAQAAGLPSVVSSTISEEVDLGMGMVRFVGLEASDRAWGAALRAAAESRLPDPQTRKQVLAQKGFSATSGARRLEQVYTAV